MTSSPAADMSTPFCQETSLTGCPDFFVRQNQNANGMGPRRSAPRGLSPMSPQSEILPGSATSFPYWSR